jgi:hypothetical protein
MVSTLERMKCEAGFKPLLFQMLATSCAATLRTPHFMLLAFWSFASSVRVLFLLGGAVHI